MSFDVNSDYEKVQYSCVWKNGKANWEAISENVKVEPTNSTNTEEENVDSDITPLLGESCSTNSPPENKNMLERFFTNLVRSKTYF